MLHSCTEFKIGDLYAMIPRRSVALCSQWYWQKTTIPLTRWRMAVLMDDRTVQDCSRLFKKFRRGKNCMVVIWQDACRGGSTEQMIAQCENLWVVDLKHPRSEQAVLYPKLQARKSIHYWFSSASFPHSSLRDSEKVLPSVEGVYWSFCLTVLFTPPTFTRGKTALQHYSITIWAGI